MSKWLRVAACVVLASFSLVASAVGEESQSQDNSYTLPFADIPLYERAPTNPPAAQPAAEAAGTPTNQPGAVNGDKRLVNDLGNTKKISFLGTQLFTSEQLQRALQSDLKYQAAARPSADLTRLLTTLQERVIEGYRYCGCPDAKVDVWRDEANNAIQVQVAEGPRFRQGRVVVSGPPAIDSTVIEQMLTTRPQPRPWRIERDGVNLTDASDDDESAWKEGDDVHYDTRSVEAINATVRRALAEQGFPRANFETSFIPLEGSDTTELNVEIKVLSTPARIDGIEITGLKRNTRDELLQFVGVSMGDALDAALLDRVHTRLKHCCRFWKYRVAAAMSDATSNADAVIQPAGNLLSIDLEEYTEVPPLGKQLAEADEVLKKVGLRLNELKANESGSDVVVEASGLQDVAGGIKALRTIFASDGRIAFEILSAPNSPWTLDHAIFAAPGSFEVYDWQAKQRFVLPMPLHSLFCFSVKPTHEDGGEFQIKMMFGIAANSGERRGTADGGAAPWSIDVEPVALLHLAHEKDTKQRRISVRRGEFKYSDRNATLRLDAETGRLRELRIKDSDADKQMLIVARLDQGAFDRTTNVLRANGSGFVNLYNVQNRLGSAVQFALSLVEKQPVIAQTPAYASYCRIARQVQANSLSSRLWNRWQASNGVSSASGKVASDEVAREFAIPTTYGGSTESWSEVFDRLLVGVPGIADQMFPRGSWPWTLSRESCFDRIGNRYLSDDKELEAARRISKFARLDDQNVGPISALFIAKICCAFGSEEDFQLAARFAQKGLRDTSVSAFRNDASLLTEGELGLPLMCCAFAEEFGKLTTDEQQPVISTLPPIVQEALTRLAKRRTEYPNESAADSIRNVLVDQQDIGLRSMVVHELHDVSQRVANAFDDSTKTK